MKYTIKIEIGLCFIILTLVLIYLSSCVQALRPVGYAPIEVYEPPKIEKRVKIVQYWRGGIPGYYYEYPSGSAGGGVYRWYDTGEVIWDYEPGILDE